MKWNASKVAPLFLLLAGCMGGSGGYSNAGLEPASGQGSLAAQSWEGAPPQADTYRADPYAGSPQATAGGPGAGYERPGSGYDQPRPELPQTQPQQNYVPGPAQQASDGYADPAAGASGPSGRSGSARHDAVGYAGVRGVAGGDAGSVVAVHRSLPAGSFVEVTALENGRTILVLITGTLDAGAEHLIDLSPAAARQLGSDNATIPVRVRAINPTGPDQAALRQGQPASERPDTPPVLLNALRKQLPAYVPPRSVAATPPVSNGRPAAAAPVRAAPGTKGYYVQIGAFSNAANAQGLARSLGGFVRAGGGLHRVQKGPYRTAAEAEAARADVARRGYGDARVFTQN
jgi:rare lipoprotein A